MKETVINDVSKTYVYLYSIQTRKNIITFFFNRARQGWSKELFNL